MASPSEYVVVSLEEAGSFMERCIVAVGANPDHARDLRELLVSADYRGHYSHGMNRLAMYVEDIQGGTTAKDGAPVILKEMASTAWVDGQNVLGPVVGRFCTDLAIKKAKETGMGMVSAKGSNHFGIAGWYTMRCTEAGLLGMSFTNTSPLVLPTRGRTPILGTNPLSLAAPGKDGDDFVLDMATSTVAFGKVELNDMKKIPIPSGWGANSKGQVTEDPSEVLQGGGLLALGGPEHLGGYKGYGLSMGVEIMCGILAAAHFGPNVRNWKNKGVEADLGQGFMAINPDAFAPGFPERMSEFMNACRTTEPAEGEKEVLVAGDPERQHMKKVDADGGLTYHKNLIQLMADLAKDLGIEPMKPNA